MQRLGGYSVVFATLILSAAILTEGLWIVAALAVGGDRGGWLDYVIAAWCLMTLSLLVFWRLPILSIGTALFNLVVCVHTFYSAGHDFHDPQGLLYRHCIDLVIFGAAILGFAGRLRTSASVSSPRTKEADNGF